jgi:hypothetical protein
MAPVGRSEQSRFDEFHIQVFQFNFTAEERLVMPVGVLVGANYQPKPTLFANGIGGCIIAPKSPLVGVSKSRWDSHRHHAFLRPKAQIIK